MFRVRWFLLLPGLLVAAMQGSGRPASELGTPHAITRIALQPVLTTGLSLPLQVTHARDGSRRIFVVEQIGRIRVLQPGSSVPTVFLDIRARVRVDGEQGLLGLAFHPQFASNRRFFVHYTRPDQVNVVAEYQVSSTDANAADPNEMMVLAMPQPFGNHNGGMIEFGPDGYLYIAKGDGGSGNDPGNRAQNVNELLGKILRIDVDRPASASVRYSSPPSNPFFGSTSGRDEIYATGLRNPWRFSFDRLTGELYVGDVGQNAVEEVDRVTLGGNYGWRVFEGTRCTAIDPCNSGAFIPPITEYRQTPARCSVTGGYVYRGSAQSLPWGAYIFGDYCSGEIFMFLNGTQSVLLGTGFAISSFGEDEAGEIYVVAHGGGVYRITNPDAAVPTLTFPSLVTADARPPGFDATERTGIAVANLGGGSATVTIRALDQRGALIAGPNIVNPRSVMLGAGEQFAGLDSEIFGSGFGASGRVGWMRLESSLREITGFFLSFNTALTMLDGADVSAPPMTSMIFPEVETRGFTRIHVVNPNSDSTSVRLEWIGGDGSARGSLMREIAGNGAEILQSDTLFGGAVPDESDYLRLTASQGVTAVEMLGRSGFYVMALNGVDASAGSPLLYAPQYAVGGAWHSSLSLINLEPTASNLTLRLLREDGTQIGPSRQRSIAGRGKLYISDPSFFENPGGNVVQGYVEVTGDVKLAGSVVFGDPRRDEFASALPLFSSLKNEMIFSQVASDSTYFTGLAVLNPGALDLSATIQVRDEQGRLAASTTEVLRSRTRRSGLLTQFFPALAGRPMRAGYIRVLTDRGAAGFALFGTHSLSALSAVPAQEVRR